MQGGSRSGRQARTGQRSTGLPATADTRSPGGGAARILSAGLRSAGSMAVALLTLEAAPASAVCVPFPCDACWVVNSGQLNLVILDRDEGLVRLVPNVRFQGDSPQIALVVPTPAVPTLEAAPARIWSDASALTAPVPSDADFDGFGCSQVDRQVAEPTLDDVTVLATQTVGAFSATTVESADPEAIVRWLRNEGFEVDAAAAARFAPLVADGWVFTAMKSDSSLVMPEGGWNANVDPVEFRWSGNRFEIPLELLGTNRAGLLPMTFFVLDAHRVQIPDFAVNYANRLSRSETEAIGRLYPALGRYLLEGRFFTRLDRRFTSGTPMEGRVEITWAPHDEEFRQGVNRAGGSAGWLPLVAGLAALLALARGIAARARPVPGSSRSRAQ